MRCNLTPAPRKPSQVEVAVAEVVAEERKESGVAEFIFPVTQSAIRTIMIDGNPWFVAKDVCDALGLNTGNISRDLDVEEIEYLKLRDSGKPNVIINESGLYSLILRSRKEEAKVFKKWITGTVLPAIRKDGMYVMGDDSLIARN